MYNSRSNITIYHQLEAAVDFTPSFPLLYTSIIDTPNQEINPALLQLTIGGVSVAFLDIPVSTTVYQGLLANAGCLPGLAVLRYDE
jgi:hypothetical protein